MPPSADRAPLAGKTPPSDVLRGSAILIALWAILLWGGYPFPHADDGSFMGSALNFARGQGLTNPLLEDTGPFYSYPPIYCTFLGSWLALAGSSAASVRCFDVTLSFFATWWTVRTCQIIGREVLGWALALALMTYFAGVGLRADVCSMFFLALSFRCGVELGKGRWLAPFFAMLAVATLPAALAISLPWLGYLLIPRRDLWIAFAVGFVTALLLLDLTIGGQVHDFWIGFSQNMHRARHVSWLYENWYHPQGLIKFILLPLACLVLGGIAIRRRGCRWMDAMMALSILLGFFGTVSSISGQRILDLALVGGIGLYLYEARVEPRASICLTGGLGLLFFFTFGRPLVQGMTCTKPSHPEELLREVDALHPARLMVDSWTLRYVFDYQLRPGMILLGFSTRPHASMPAPQKYPDECWVISAESTNFSNLTAPGAPVPRHQVFLGQVVRDWVVNAGELAVLPPDNPAR